MRVKLLLFVLVLITATGSVAQAEKRVALVIGNDTYKTLPSLSNAGNDARAVTKKLKAIGFKVINGINVDRTTFFRRKTEFENELHDAQVALVYYAGHGIQDGRGTNWLIPSDSNILVESDLQAWGVNAQELLSSMQYTETPTNILILDACRDNPLPKRTRSAAKGLRTLEMKGNEQSIIVVYAAAPGQVAQDGPEGGNGIFTRALLAYMDKPGLTLEQVFKRTTAKVLADTKGNQRPWREGSVPHDFYFVPKGSKVTVEPPAGPDPETVLWQTAEGLGTKAAFEAYLKDYPTGRYASAAKLKLTALTPAPTPKPMPSATGEPPPETSGIQAFSKTMYVRSSGKVNVRTGPGANHSKIFVLDTGDKVEVTGQDRESGWYRVSLAGGVVGFVHGELLQEKRANSEPVAVNFAKGAPGSVFRDCAGCPEMVIIPSGQFRMGDNFGGGHSSEKPTHLVTIDYAFAVGKFEVTQAEWRAVMGNNPSRFKHDQNPVENVSWDDAQSFVQKLSQRTGQQYRLLSESEWEYVARGYTHFKYSCGNADRCLESVAWYDRNSGKKTHPVGTKLANSFGVHDMHGNVWEWVEDCYSQNYAGKLTDGSARKTGKCSSHIMRGGSWFNIPRDIRAANRNWRSASRKVDVGTTGFRVATTVLR
ncbi:MAG: SUMF1/EgtB/PvdO family nonheme iron enzyme [Magnetospiraceae bacterium]